MRALHAGKHVLFEKSYTRRPREVEEAFGTGRAGRPRADGGLHVAAQPADGALRRAAAGDRRAPDDSRDVLVRAHRAEDVRLVPELGGGSLLDVGCYCARAYACSRAASRTASTARRCGGRGGVDEVFAAVLRFGDVTAEFTCGLPLEHRGLEAIGTRARSSPPTRGTRGGRARRQRPRGAHGADEPLPARAGELRAAVRGDGKPLLGRDDALGQARTLDALLRSAETHHAISLTP